MILEAVFKEEEAVKADFGVVHHVNKVDASFVANALKGTASGSAVAMTDVSPLEHNIGVKLASDTITDFSSVTLTKQGANLIDQSRGANTTTNNKFGITLTYIPEEDCLCLNGTNSGGNTNVGCSQPVDYILNGVVGQSYVASVKHISGKASIPSGSKWDVCFFLGQKSSPSANENANWITIHLDNTDNEATAICTKPYIGSFWAFIVGGASFDNYKFKIQLQIGTKATEYEPYKAPETIPVNGDGTATVVGNGEGMTLMTDTDGVTISAEYSRDLNKAFAEIYQAIATMGAAPATIHEEM